MGIKGLIVAVKPALEDCHVSQLAGKRVAVDGYCWLHRAVFGCCVEICRGEKSTAWLNYCLAYIDMLLNHKIHVTMVFDGADLPMKYGTEQDRRASRRSNLEKADELYRNGDKASARNFYSRAVDVSPEMAAVLIRTLKRSRPSVNCIVAPFEADAQLAYLSMNNLVDCVITEDSDTIPYGCKDILFKMERTGTCQRLQLARMFAESIDKFDLRGFTEEMVLIMCILAGCDYLNSVEGMGLKTSYKHVSKNRSAGQLLRTLRVAGQLPAVPAKYPVSSLADGIAAKGSFDLLQYELDFYQAMLTFRHQVVFDPITRKTVNRTPFSRDTFPSPLLDIWWPQAADASTLPTLPPFLGHHLSDDIACGIADGLIDPSSKQAFSIWVDEVERPLRNPVEPSTKSSLVRSATKTALGGGAVHVLNSSYGVKASYPEQLENNVNSTGNRAGIQQRSTTVNRHSLPLTKSATISYQRSGASHFQRTSNAHALLSEAKKGGISSYFRPQPICRDASLVSSITGVTSNTPISTAVTSAESSLESKPLESSTLLFEDLQRALRANGADSCSSLTGSPCADVADIYSASVLSPAVSLVAQIEVADTVLPEKSSAPCVPISSIKSPVAVASGGATHRLPPAATSRGSMISKFFKPTSALKDRASPITLQQDKNASQKASNAPCKTIRAVTEVIELLDDVNDSGPGAIATSSALLDSVVEHMVTPSNQEEVQRHRLQLKRPSSSTESLQKLQRLRYENAQTVLQEIEIAEVTPVSQPRVTTPGVTCSLFTKFAFQSSEFQYPSPL